VKKGFTLLEVMIAMALLALVLVTVFSHQAVSIDLGNEARMITRAAFLAQEKMAEVLAAEVREIGSAEGDMEEGGISFHWRTDVEESGREKLVRVVALVAWKQGGSTRDVRIVTYMAQE